MLVYKAKTPDNKVYIGITKNELKKRIQSHLSRAKNGSNLYFHNALKHHNFCVEWSILEFAKSLDQLRNLEKKYIEYFKSNDKNFGYNLTTGGDLNIPNKEIIDKIRLSRLGKKCPKQSLAMLGKTKTSKNKLNISISMGSKPFAVYDKSTNKFIGKFINKRECARILNLDNSKICDCLSGKRKSHKGLIFKEEV